MNDEQLEAPKPPIHYGRDEMNLIEFPFGPIKATSSGTLDIQHVVTDRKSRLPVVRKLTIIGSQAYGLPTPLDERVLLGLQAITQESGFIDRRIHFSRYHLCKTIGWKPDGKSYQRLERSLDRIAGTTLKFKNSWWDKGEQEWKSLTFHLIDNVELCSKDRYHNMRRRDARKEQSLCHFIWNEVPWKSFQDGYIRGLDMEMIRRIGAGRRREVPLRLYRWLAKRFYNSSEIRIDVKKLGKGTLGLSCSYPSELRRIIQRASQILIDCEALGQVQFIESVRRRGIDAVFYRKKAMPPPSVVESNQVSDALKLNQWFQNQDPEKLIRAEKLAMDSGFGSEFERKFIRPSQNKPLAANDLMRLLYIQKFLAAQAA